MPDADAILRDLVAAMPAPRTRKLTEPWSRALDYVHAKPVAGGEAAALAEALESAIADAEAYAALAPERSRPAIRKRIDGYRATLALALGRPQP